MTGGLAYNAERAVKHQPTKADNLRCQTLGLRDCKSAGYRGKGGGASASEPSHLSQIIA